MQKLHLVGITSELDGLILSTRKGAKSGDFLVTLDAPLLEVISGLGNEEEASAGVSRPARRGSAATDLPSSLLTPRQMQDRLRSGWSIEEVAASAGVSVEWVSRFAAPVIAEQARVIARAREMVFDKPRFGTSSFPVGSAVRRNVAERGVHFTEDDYDACWGAHQVEEGLWQVTFRYSSRGRLQQAEWLVDADADEISSRNRLGSQLAYVKGRGGSKPTGTGVRPKAKRRPQASKAKKAPVKKAPVKKAPVKKAPVKKAPVKKAPVKKAPVKKAPVKKAPVKKAPVRSAIRERREELALGRDPALTQIPATARPPIPMRTRPSRTSALPPTSRASWANVARDVEGLPQDERRSRQAPVPRHSAGTISQRLGRAQRSRDQVETPQRLERPVIRAPRADGSSDAHREPARPPRRRTEPLSAPRR